MLILTRNAAIPLLTSVTVAPLTTTIREIPSEVLLTPEEDGIHEVCVISLDNLLTVPKSRIGPLITMLSTSRMQDVSSAISFALALNDADYTLFLS